ncbi:MAG TPA: methyltransferase domain-containing protein [Actinocrinis sp.]
MTEPDFVSTARTFYDTVAADFAKAYGGDTVSIPLERGLLAAFADLVREDGGGPVADLGCGAGRVTAHLHALGLDVFGVDLSAQMLALARLAHPDLRFAEGSILALDLPDGSLAGLVAWYSTIHTPDAQLPRVLAEFNRVLAPGGHALLAFQVGDAPRHYDEAFGIAVDVDFHRRRPERVAELLGEAGITATTRVLREAESTERTPQAYILARKPTGPS